MNVRWTTASVADRQAIFDYIAQDNPLAAIGMDALFERSAQRLCEHPKLGKVGKLPGTRELIPHESYRLIYELSLDTVWVLALVHTARQWPPL
jgi:addiction module RelE/StbE family toxin